MALACVCALGFSAAVDAHPEARATFHVTLTAQLTKTWDYVVARQEGDCTVATRVEGSQVVTLRSSRRTVVRITGSARRVAFAPASVRFVTVRATQRGAVTTTERGPGCGRVTHADCAPQARTLANQTLSFFRSGPGKLSFRRGRDFTAGLPRACPPQHREVLAERPGLHEAQGEVSERQFFDRGIRSQTASGSFDEETQIQGNPDGKVVERISWSLRFARR